MPSIFKGVRTFVEAIRKGADNVIYRLFGLALPESDIFFQAEEKFPDLPPIPRQMTIDYTRRTKDYGEFINTLKAGDRLPLGNAPSSPLTGTQVTYWMEVEWFDPRSGENGRRLVIVNGKQGETKEQAEQRARELTEDYWDDYPEFDNEGNRIDPEFRKVNWLRGYQGGSPQ